MKNIFLFLLFTLSSGYALYAQNNCHVYVTLWQNNYTVNFNAHASSLHTNITYSWDFGDGNTSTLEDPSHTYAANGVYQASLIIVDSVGCSDTAFNTVYVSVGCSADFNHTVSNRTATFSSSVTGVPPFTYSWDFGDGNTSTQANPVHTYAPTSRSYYYPVVFLSMDANGCTDTSFSHVLIQGSCSSNFTFTQSGARNVNFSSSASGTAPISYSWNFGDGNTSTQANPSHTYAASGTYQVSLTTSDGIGCTKTTTKSITAQLVCSTDFNFSQNGILNYTFSSTVSGTAPFTYSWDFGDGNTSTQANPTHAYTSNGTYQVSLTTTDGIGCARTIIKSVNAQPTCNSSFILSRNGWTVDFTSTVSGIAPFSYTWNFGDGNTSTQANPSHTYAGNGTYQITLNTVDAAGCVGTVYRTLTINFTQNLPTVVQGTFTDASTGLPVSNVPVWFGLYDLQTGSHYNSWVPFTRTDNNGFYRFTENIPQGTSYRIHLNFRDCDSTDQFFNTDTLASGDTLTRNFQYCQNGFGCNTGITYYTTSNPATFDFVSWHQSGIGPFTYAWDFGDGNTSTLASPNHTYASHGTFQVSLLTTDSTGCMDTSYLSIVVIPTCSASFTFNQNNATFDFTSSVSGSGPFSYDWNFGDGNTSTLANPSHTYAANGTYYVSLISTDTTGCTDSLGVSVNVNANTTGNCSANFFFTQNIDTARFYSNVTGTAPFTYSWDFGDGNTSNSANPVHIYLSGGTYQVSLITEDATGCKDTVNSNISVVISCAASFVAYPRGGRDVDFVSWSRLTGPATYFWDFGDGNTSALENPSHTFPANSSSSTYLVTLVTTDSVGCVDSALRNVPISASCGSNFTYNQSPIRNVDFSSSVSGTAPFVYAWDFGDGNTSTQANPSHTYANYGYYQVSLYTTDADGCADSTSRGIYVTPSCNTGFTFDTRDRYANFISSVSGISPFTYSWDFGDGHTSSLANPSHTYASYGTYHVSLLTVDSIGCVDTAHQRIILTPSCSANFDFVKEGIRDVQFTSHANGINPISYLWDFGDGNTSTLGNPLHTYVADGNYLVQLITTDSIGCMDSVSKWVGTIAKIEGQVWTSDTTHIVNEATVYLISVDTTSAGLALSLIDSTDVTQSLFRFSHIPIGNYLLKAALKPSSSVYLSNLPTYYSSSLRWDAGMTYAHQDPFGYPVIQLQAGVNPGGPGFIGGLVSQGANKTVGGALGGMQVNLLKADGVPVAYTYTDANGIYEFEDLAYGEYIIYVEVLGLESEELTITLDANNPRAEEKDFEVGVDFVSIATQLAPFIQPGSLLIFPNPVDNLLKVEVELKQMAWVQLSILDLIGREVMVLDQGNKLGKQSFELNTSTLPPGVYFVELEIGDQILLSKLVKK